MHCKSYSHFFSKIFQHICVSLDVNFNESLTNDFVSFEQLGPGHSHLSRTMCYHFSCQANVSVAQIRENKTETTCEIEERPSLAVAIIHIFAFFGAGVAMSSWSWTKASLEAWKRLFRRWVTGRFIAQDERGYRHNVFLISPQKHVVGTY